MTNTALMRRGSSPVAPFFQGFDRVFDSMLEPLRTFPGFEGWLSDTASPRAWVPPVDIRETDEAFLVSAELPGLTKKDIDVTVENNQLTITGERTWDDETRGTIHRVERGYGKFSRSFMLASHVDAEAVKARFVDGVLEITIPKAENARPRRIAIN